MDNETALPEFERYLRRRYSERTLRGHQTLSQQSAPVSESLSQALGGGHPPGY